MTDRPAPRGRGSNVSPPNRFALTRVEVEPDLAPEDLPPDPRTRFLVQQAASIVTENDSPDIPFRYGLNPYRGCEHGCSYCFARPTHEYLGLDAGLGFETGIVVKENAAELFRDFLCRDRWVPEPIAMSGVTDCYQPCERRFRLTRGCLEVAAEARQPMAVITKNALVLRDLDILEPMAAGGVAHVHVSLTTLDAGLARSMEPRTSPPAARLRAVRALADAGVLVNVLVAPVIPGLNDSEIPALLEAAKAAGASSAGWQLLRLPLTVAPVFREWLTREQPTRADKVEGRVRDARGGRLNDAEFGRRMSGTGEMADQIGRLFRVFARRHGLDRPPTPLDCSRFRPPRPRSGQMLMF
ncbi:MAG: PA0069 family radical SAM protein [Gemmataceae bacterium]